MPVARDAPDTGPVCVNGVDEALIAIGDDESDLVGAHDGGECLDCQVEPSLVFSKYKDGRYGVGLVGSGDMGRCRSSADGRDGIVALAGIWRGWAAGVMGDADDEAVGLCCFSWASSISVLASAMARFERAILREVRRVLWEWCRAVWDWLCHQIYFCTEREVDAPFR